MTEILSCLGSACSIIECWPLLVDFFAPIIAEMILIGLLFEGLMRIRERRQWKPARQVMYSRLLRMQDNLLYHLVPIELRDEAVLGEVQVAGFTLDTLFNWQGELRSLLDEQELSDQLVEQRALLIEQLMYERTNIDEIIQLHANQIEPQLFKLMIDLRQNIERCLSFMNTTAASDYEANVIMAGKEVISSLFRLREWLLSQSEVRFVQTERDELLSSFDR